MARYADLSPAEQQAASAEIARAECEAQGIPFTVVDPSVLARVARIAAGEVAPVTPGSSPGPAVVSREGRGDSSGEVVVPDAASPVHHRVAS